MGVCWYCHWGWAKPVVEIYDKALDKLNGNIRPLHFGPSHLVWEDENFESAEWCLEHFDDYYGDCPIPTTKDEGYSDEELAIVKWSLKKLAALPMEVRCVQPKDYDEEHPEKYPPKVETIRR